MLTYRISPELRGRFGAGSVGSAMPALSVKTLEGARITREQLAGKVVLVNFWASWCGPCTVEMPAFQRAYAQYRDSGLVILGVWIRDTDAFRMRGQLRDGGITYPIVVGSEELAEAFGGVHGLPVSVLVDRSGHIRRRVFGIFHEPDFRADVLRLLRE